MSSGLALGARPVRAHWRRGPLLAATLTLVALLAGSSAAWELDRSAVDDGQLWRLWTGHFVHYGPAHAMGDIVAFFGWAAVLEAINRRLLAVALVCTLTATGVGVWLLCPQVMFYGGLSAIDVGLSVTLLCVLASSARLARLPGSRVLVYAILTGHVVKAVYEVWQGHALLAPDLGPGVQLLPAAHFFGGAAGALAFAIERRLCARPAALHAQPPPEHLAVIEAELGPGDHLAAGVDDLGVHDTRRLNRVLPGKSPRAAQS
jgi:rhomboid family GlyGly-CTERM serine protease